MIQDSNADVRISVIVNPFDGTNDDNTIDINQIVLATLHSLPVDKAIRFIRNIIKEDVANGKIDIEVIIFFFAKKFGHANKYLTNYRKIRKRL